MNTRYVLEESNKGRGTLSLQGVVGATATYELNVYAKEQAVNGSWLPVGFKDARVSVWSIHENEPGFLWRVFSENSGLVTLTLQDGRQQKLIMSSYSVMSGAAAFVATGGLEQPA